MQRLLDTSGLRAPLTEAIAGGLAVLGTCAGAIVLAREVLDGRPDQVPLGVIDIVDPPQRLRPPARFVRGRPHDRGPARAARSRACSSGRRPSSAVGEAVEVLAEHNGRPVLAREARVWVTTFHPELARDLRLHERFLQSRRSAQYRWSGASTVGHSKWHSIKHAKGAADAARGKVFARLARQIEVAARSGGGDVDGNPSLRTMVQKARDASMPKDNIERAIKRGTGELEGVTYEEVHYEGYAPNGVAVFVETLTDNRNRTGAEIKNVVHAATAARSRSRARCRGSSSARAW